MKQTWDVFCRVVDNFGDAGVCWRLARQLVKVHGVAVRLWIDDVGALAAIWAGVNGTQCVQCIDGVVVCVWDDAVQWSDVLAADVVIEAFACRIPEGYVNQMLVKKNSNGVAPHWINLEYLSAESWIDGCHGMCSPQNNGLAKTFFFPGFSSKSGGLLRGNESFNRHRVQLKSEDWTRLTGFDVQGDALKVVLFGYEHMPLIKWLPLLDQSHVPIQLAVTCGKATDAVKSFFNENNANLSSKLHVSYLPMLQQNDFDLLLRGADLNFVRGEDSFVQALWAGKPFVWHIYPQHDAVHFEKLEAFIKVYCQNAMMPEALKSWADWQRVWNLQPDVVFRSQWSVFVENIDALHQHAELYREHLLQTDDLAQQLVQHATTPLA